MAKDVPIIHQDAERFVGRHIGAHHLAFFRGFIDGVPLARLAEQYLETGEDPRRAITTLNWIRDELVAAARRHGDYGTARLIRVNPGVISDTASGAASTPSLDEFAAQRDPDGFYSQRELLELFKAEFAPRIDRKSQRRIRLRTRLLRALEHLETLLVVPPQPDHEIAGWLDPTLAKRFEAIGLRTLDDLVRFINLHGFRFYSAVPRVGKIAAARVVSWLQSHADRLGALAPTALAPKRTVTADLVRRRPPTQTIAPFEYFRVPIELDGTHASNRAAPERNKTGARNDYEAIHAWLRMRPEGSHTWRAYRTQAERFLLWAIFEKRKALSDLTANDCADYQRFLLSPEPADRWIAPRHIERWNDAWRPFSGPLAASSVATAITILASLCKWLVSQRYLDSNPFDGVPAQEAVVIEEETERSLTQVQWEFVLRHAIENSEGERQARARFALLFAYGTALRRAEIAEARAGDLRRFVRRGALDDGWMLRVVGKRKRVRTVPVPSPVIESLADYCQARGLARNPDAWPPDAPLLAQLGPAGLKPLSAPAVGAMYKAFFQRAATQLDQDNPANAAQLARASAHWLRHSHGSHAVEQGAAVEVLQRNFGHRSLATTTIYVTAEQSRRYEEIEAFMRNAMSKLWTEPAAAIT